MPYSVDSISSGLYSAFDFNYSQGRVLIGNAVGASSITLALGFVTINDGTQLFPYATNAPLLIDIGSIQETVTPSAVVGGMTPGVGNCFITATFANAHGQGCQVASGTFGLQEAINAANAAGGGVVVADASWAALGGTSAMLAAAVNGSKVQVLDYRGTAGIQIWTFNGTTFQIGNGLPQSLLTVNGAIPVVAGQYFITKAGVLADTLAAPTAAQNGLVITVTSRTAFAHTITATGLLNAGVAGVNLATFAAFPGASITFTADTLKWNVSNLIGVTIT